MTITEHKRLISQIPEDLREGEEIEVSNSGEFWEKQKFSHIGFNDSDGFWIEAEHGTWNYARRPAAAQKKRLSDDDVEKIILAAKASLHRHKSSIGGQMCCVADMFEYHIIVEAIKHYDSTDWQNSLERRPE